MHLEKSVLAPLSIKGYSIAEDPYKVLSILFTSEFMEIKYINDSGFESVINLKFNPTENVYEGFEDNNHDHKSFLRVFKDEFGRCMIFGTWDYKYNKGSIKNETRVKGKWIFEGFLEKK